MAQRRRVSGWRQMRKTQLVRALVKANGVKAGGAKANGAKTVSAVAKKSPTKAAAKSKSTKTLASKAVARSKAHSTKQKPRSPQSIARVRRAMAAQDRRKNLASGKPGTVKRDRLVVMVRDAYWLHAYWELRPESIQRAEAAMGQDWHGAKPVLRVLDVGSGSTTSAAERVLRDIDIHGGAHNWYVNVDQSLSYRLEIGYLARSGRFFALGRSNVVSTPKAGASDVVDENWNSVVADFDRIFALSGGYNQAGNSHELQELFEERLQRPMGSPFTTRYGRGLEGVVNGSKEKFEFDLDAELLVFGKTRPDAHVTLSGDPVAIRPDGSFTMRFNLPNARMVIPAVSSSADGVEQRTIVLAIERNTKVLEPLVRDAND